MRVVVVLDCLQPDRLAQFWAEALGYRRAPAGGPYVVLVPDRQPGPELVLQRVPEPKAGKNRMHLDIRVPELQPELARLTAHGANVLTPEPIHEDGFSWVVMADPEGNDREGPSMMGTAARPLAGQSSVPLPGVKYP